MFELGDYNPRTFRNRVEALKHLADTIDFHGQRRAVTDLHMPTDGSDGGYGAYYHNFLWKMTFAQYQQLAPVAQRLRSLHHYLTEVYAEWADVPGTTTYWADNSVEVTQVNRWGQTRTRTLVAAHGDACF